MFGRASARTESPRDSRTIPVRQLRRPATDPTNERPQSCEPVKSNLFCQVAGKARSFGFMRPAGIVTTSLPTAVIEIHEVDVRRKVEKNSLLGGNFVQRFIDVRQMMVRDVAHELPVDF